MTRQDFNSRVKRIDPYYASGNSSNASVLNADTARPFLWLLVGFGWAYVCLAVARNRDVIEHSLLQGRLAHEHHAYVFYGLAAMLGISAVMLAIHFVRYTFTDKRSATKGNSGGLLFGAMIAAGIVYTPASVFEAAFGLLDDNSRSLIVAATEAVPVDFGSVAFVSSAGGH
ncbi:hypothetical protein AL036_04740 [Salipiger aestuarii]|nr:hypothetical protein C357_04842 [Citreicella sp. 357]KAA8609139.1 hypothetical protein AL036_04740 [Salipiger aestuarii]KAA8614342.1 hypothetical protein AL037_03340 [Salipiger aestuarii]KAB2542830.1 hypothetical protein AL035_05015 [Salipiger aestuarii]